MFYRRLFNHSSSEPSSALPGSANYPPDHPPDHPLNPSLNLPLERQSRLIETCSQLGLALGIVVRLVQYLSNRSLWFDEAAVALNLIERNYKELLGALSYDQAAPPLFLWIEEFSLNTFGNHEYALRLYPLLSGLLSLFIFYRFTRTFTTGWARPIAIFLFAVLSYIVYFAGDVKPYSGDVMLGLLLFMGLTSIATLRPGFKSVLGLGVLGVVSIWLSFPSILVMAGVEATNVIKLKLWRLSQVHWRAFLARRLPLYGAWLMSLVGLYVINIRKTLAETDLASSWVDRYPAHGLDLLWLLNALGQFFYRPLGFFTPADGLAMGAFVVGCVHLYRTQRWRLAYLASPFMVTLLAAYLHQYPFKDRLILFLVPYGLVILAEGMALLIRRWRSRPKVLGWLGLALAVSLLLLPLGHTLPRLVQPSRAHFDEVRPAIAHLHQSWQPGDKLYVFRWSQLQFKYYQTRFDFPPDDILLSQIDDFGLHRLKENDVQRFSQEINQLKQSALKDKPRVWFLLARQEAAADVAILEAMDKLGAPIARTRYPDVVLSLQDLSK